MQSFPAGGRDWVAGELREESVGHRALCPPVQPPNIPVSGPWDPESLTAWDGTAAAHSSRGTAQGKLLDLSLPWASRLQSGRITVFASQR